MFRCLGILILLSILPLWSIGQQRHVEFAKDTIKGQIGKEYMVPLKGKLQIDMYPSRVVRPMGIEVIYLSSEDGKQWNTYKTTQMETGAMEQTYRTKIECTKCKIRVNVKLLSLFEFRMTATEIKH